VKQAGRESSMVAARIEHPAPLAGGMAYGAGRPNRPAPANVFKPLSALYFRLNMTVRVTSSRCVLESSVSRLKASSIDLLAGGWLLYQVVMAA
jgi:hypothetical protein